jgi:hypothetical protein
MKLYHPVRWLPLLAVLVVGCGGGSLPPQADPDEARRTLTAALDAWKGGETAEALTARQPPIYFNDLKPEHRLLSYAIADGHEMYGQSVRLSVTLSLKLPDGSTKERKVTYLIDTAPARVIVQG